MMFMAQCFSCRSVSDSHFRTEFQVLNAFSRSPHTLLQRRTVLLTFQHELRRLQPGNAGLHRLQGVLQAEAALMAALQHVASRRQETGMHRQWYGTAGPAHAAMHWCQLEADSSPGGCKGLGSGSPCC